ncbi:TonB-dependent receptor [Marinilabiliaceae bacterium AAT]|uniref:TonB-dependent receptor n=1 Tax=Plebeiibacterium sediminum TaxID=2992112 RepID=A0AAE3M505_9BACT|nr:TonB-dependent receptor [Plebeiobacterium sediminum]
MLGSIFTVRAQNKFSISGSITDSGNGETLIGTTVYLKEQPTLGTITNAYGFYSISAPEDDYTLVVSFIGYENYEKEIHLTSDLRMDVALHPNNQQLTEVVVSSKKKNSNVTSVKMGVEKLNPKDVESLPVLLGEQDVVRTLTLTPGVKTTGDGSGGMFVRGGNNSQNMILLDEATVYNSSHMMGFFSTFNSDAIKDLTMYKGTAPAEYGGRLSSVMDIKMKEGNNRDYHVGGGIGLLYSKLNVEGPIVKDKGSFFVAGRRTYADLFMRMSPDEDINGNELYFYDLNLKANYKINDNNRIYVSGYFGRDVMSSQDVFGMDWGNETGTVRWNHVWGSKLFSNSTFIYSEYMYRMNANFGNLNMGLRSEINNINLKQDFMYFLNSKNTLSFGLFGTRGTMIPGQVEVDDDSTLHPEDLEDRYYWEYGAYISEEWKINSRLTVVAGLRANGFNLVGEGDFYSYDEDGLVTDTTHYSSGENVKGYLNLEPRFNIAYVLNDKNSLKFSYARNTQNLHLIQNSTTSMPTDMWVPSSQNVKTEISDQISGGYFKNFNDDKFQFSGELYYKWMQNQIDLRDGADIFGNELIEGEFLYGKGRAYGLELMVKKTSGKMSGWVSYTLSKTEKQIDEVNNGKWYDARQDATHDISVVAMYKLSPKWDLSASWVFNTGNAVTFPTAKYQANNDVAFYYTERNGYRMPDYHRLDIGATCKLKKTEKFESSLNFGIYNAYGRKNAFLIDFDVAEDDPTRTEATKTFLFTFMPSITYNFKF